MRFTLKQSPKYNSLKMLSLKETTNQQLYYGKSSFYYTNGTI